MATKRQKQRSRQIAENMGFPTSLPECPVTENQEEIDSAIMTALNWLNVVANPQKERSWAVKYFKEKNLFNGTDIARIKVMDKSLFDRFGRYCHMVLNGYPETDWIIEYIEKGTEKVQNYLNRSSAKQTNSSEKPVVNVQERMDNKASEICGDILHIIDEFVSSVSERKKSEDSSFIDISSCIEQYEIKGMVASKMVPLLKEDKMQYVEALNDKEIKQAYTFTDSQMKRIIAVYDSFLDAIQEKKIQRKTRKPRKKKQISPIKMTEKVKYLNETTDYDGVKSIVPSKIVGATKLMVFNVKYRTFTIYESVDASGFTVKGTTIYNFDTKKSVSKRIREQYVKELLKTSQKEGIRAIRTKYNSIKSKEATPNGRLNGDCLILRAL